MEGEGLAVLEEDAAGARGRSPWAGRSCPTRTGCTAGGRTGRARRRAAGAGAGSPSSACHAMAPGTASVAPASSRRYGTTTTASRPGSAARTAATSPGAVDVAIAVPVAVDGEQHPRLDLGQPVDDRPDAELRRARRPHGAQRRGGEERDDRLRDVGQVRGHPVAPAHAERDEARPAARDGVAQLVRGERHALARLRHADEDLVRTRAPGHRQRVLGVAQRRTREPARAGHAGIGEGGSGTAGLVRRPDVEVVPDRLPERAGLIDGPAPRGVVVVEDDAPLARQPRQVAAHPRPLAGVGGRRPEDGRRGVVGRHAATVAQPMERR